MLADRPSTPSIPKNTIWSSSRDQLRHQLTSSGSVEAMPVMSKSFARTGLEAHPLILLPAAGAQSQNFVEIAGNLVTEMGERK